MAKLVGNAAVDLKLLMEITEGEARAICALGNYGAREVVAILGKYVSENMAEIHGPSLTLFLDSFRQAVIPLLASADQARKLFAAESRGS